MKLNSKFLKFISLLLILTFSITSTTAYSDLSQTPAGPVSQTSHYHVSSMRLVNQLGPEGVRAELRISQSEDGLSKRLPVTRAELRQAGGSQIAPEIVEVQAGWNLINKTGLESVIMQIKGQDGKTIYQFSLLPHREGYVDVFTFDPSGEKDTTLLMSLVSTYIYGFRNGTFHRMAINKNIKDVTDYDLFVKVSQDSIDIFVPEHPGSQGEEDRIHLEVFRRASRAELRTRAAILMKAVAIFAMASVGMYAIERFQNFIATLLIGLIVPTVSVALMLSPWFRGNFTSGSKLRNTEETDAEFLELMKYYLREAFLIRYPDLTVLPNIEVQMSSEGPGFAYDSGTLIFKISPTGRMIAKVNLRGYVLSRILIIPRDIIDQIRSESGDQSPTLTKPRSELRESYRKIIAQKSRAGNLYVFEGTGASAIGRISGKDRLQVQDAEKARAKFQKHYEFVRDMIRISGRDKLLTRHIGIVGESPTDPSPFARYRKPLGLEVSGRLIYTKGNTIYIGTRLIDMVRDLGSLDRDDFIVRSFLELLQSTSDGLTQESSEQSDVTISDSESQLLSILVRWNFAKGAFILQTGGTIDMQGDEARGVAGAVAQMLEKLTSKVAARYSAIKKDSSNIGPSDWKKIIASLNEIMRLKFQAKEELAQQGFRVGHVGGVVITHGTDTMEETATMLSLKENHSLRMPIIITGAHSPPDVPGSDAERNLARSIEAVLNPELLPRVYVFEGDRLIPADQIEKVRTAPIKGKPYIETARDIAMLFQDDGSTVLDQHYNRVLQPNRPAPTQTVYSEENFGYVEELVVDIYTPHDVFLSSQARLLSVLSQKPKQRSGLILYGDIANNAHLSLIRQYALDLIRHGIPVWVASKNTALVLQSAGVQLIPKQLRYGKARTMLSTYLEMGWPIEKINDALQRQIVIGDADWTNYESFPPNNYRNGTEVVLVFPGIEPSVYGDAVKRLLASRHPNPKLFLYAFGDGNIPLIEGAIQPIIEQYLKRELPELLKIYHDEMAKALLKNSKLESPEAAKKANDELMTVWNQGRLLERVFANVPIVTVEKFISRYELIKPDFIVDRMVAVANYRAKQGIQHPQQADILRALKTIVKDEMPQSLQDLLSDFESTDSMKSLKAELARSLQKLDWRGVAEVLVSLAKIWRNADNETVDERARAIQKLQISNAWMKFGESKHHKIPREKPAIELRKSKYNPDILSQLVIQEALSTAHPVLNDLAYFVNHGGTVVVRTKVVLGTSDITFYTLGNMLLGVGAESEAVESWRALPFMNRSAALSEQPSQAKPRSELRTIGQKEREERGEFAAYLRLLDARLRDELMYYARQEILRGWQFPEVRFSYRRDRLVQILERQGISVPKELLKAPAFVDASDPQVDETDHMYLEYRTYGVLSGPLLYFIHKTLRDAPAAEQRDRAEEYLKEENEERLFEILLEWTRADLAGFVSWFDGLARQVLKIIDLAEEKYQALRSNLKAKERHRLDLLIVTLAYLEQIVQAAYSVEGIIGTGAVEMLRQHLDGIYRTFEWPRKAFFPQIGKSSINEVELWKQGDMELMVGNQLVFNKAYEKVIKKMYPGNEWANVLTRILPVFTEVPRHLFVPRYVGAAAYQEDSPIRIGYEQSISQPSLVGLILALANPKPTDRVLEIGSGTGWLAALLSRLASRGSVYAIERIPHLAERARRTLGKLKIRNVQILTSDGTRGYAKRAPYHVIIVSAGAENIPEPLVDQLAEGGRLIIPVRAGEDHDGKLYRLQILEKQKGELVKITEIDSLFRFVPLLTPRSELRQMAVDGQQLSVHSKTNSDRGLMAVDHRLNRAELRAHDLESEDETGSINPFGDNWTRAVEHARMSRGMEDADLLELLQTSYNLSKEDARRAIDEAQKSEMRQIKRTSEEINQLKIKIGGILGYILQGVQTKQDAGRLLSLIQDQKFWTHKSVGFSKSDAESITALIRKILLGPRPKSSRQTIERLIQTLSNSVHPTVLRAAVAQTASSDGAPRRPADQVSDENMDLKKVLTRLLNNQDFFQPIDGEHFRWRFWQEVEITPANVLIRVGVVPPATLTPRNDDEEERTKDLRAYYQRLLDNKQAQISKGLEQLQTTIAQQFNKQLHNPMINYGQVERLILNFRTADVDRKFLGVYTLRFQRIEPRVMSSEELANEIEQRLSRLNSGAQVSLSFNGNFLGRYQIGSHLAGSPIDISSRIGSKIVQLEQSEQTHETDRASRSYLLSAGWKLPTVLQGGVRLWDGGLEIQIESVGFSRSELRRSSTVNLSAPLTTEQLRAFGSLSAADLIDPAVQSQTKVRLKQFKEALLSLEGQAAISDARLMGIQMTDKGELTEEAKKTNVFMLLPKGASDPTVALALALKFGKQIPVIILVRTPGQAVQISAQIPSGYRAIVQTQANAPSVLKAIHGRAHIHAYGVSDDAKLVDQYERILKADLTPHIFRQGSDLALAIGVARLAETIRTQLRQIWALSEAA